MYNFYSDMKRLKELLLEFRALKISLSLKFIIGTAVVLTIAMSLSTYLIIKKDKKLVIEQLNMQAKTLFSQIVLTRQWIADHGGIFVEKVPWKKPNPYLSEAEMEDISGKKYIKESPAMVTKELSEYAKKAGAYWFNITSLKLINPNNKPDEFERTSLVAFESEQNKEFAKVEKIGQSYFYRYIAPLYIEQSCLKCHSHQGYKIGDVRGAISVCIPMDYALVMIASETKTMVLTSIATIIILMIVLFIMMKELVLNPVNRLKISMMDFAKGKETEIPVTRTGDELEDLNKAFVTMSKSLREYHTDLESKVQSATKSLAEANARLTELNEKKSDFIAKVSHELRTPLTSIKGAMDYITAKFSMIPATDRSVNDLQEFFDVIKNNADRLIRMVNDTLDIERIESGIFDLQMSEIDLLSLIKEVITGLQTIAGGKKVTFRITSATGTILIDADEDRIRQVLINLLSNAINYSPEDSEIHIAVKESDEKVTVSVKDRGPGIHEDVQKKIFDKFYTIGRRQGTGLGLAICKGIIEAHRGEINVISGKDEGSTFYFSLPKKVEESK
ncbi:MAG: ATP-binding protein [Nitrospirota bacterium]